MFSFSPPRGVARGKSHEGIVRRGNGCPYGLMHAHPRRTAVPVWRTVPPTSPTSSSVPCSDGLRGKRKPIRSG